MKTVLIVGNGGRESSFAWALSSHNVIIAAGDDDISLLVQEKKPDFVIIGPEVPLVEGLADVLRATGVRVFGPGKVAAQLEGSKAFAERFMNRHAIPRPDTTIITADTAAPYQIERAANVVLKADGLAQGKGVVLPKTQAEADKVLQDMLNGELFGGAGKNCVLVQERLHGPEVSVFVLTDGKSYTILPYTQDHKRLKDGDEGPNTGGMGAYAPVPEAIVSSEQRKKITDIVEQTIHGLQADGIEYRGVLYVGIMLAKERGNDPVVIEYNVRFGDPEAQVLLPLLRASSADILGLLESTDEVLKPISQDDTPDKAVLTVCLAAAGYPESPEKGAVIYGLDKDYTDVHVFHGGVRQHDGVYTVNGGRVLYVTGVGDTINQAAARAYAAIGEDAIHFDGMQYRRDIGWQARSL